MTQDVVILVIFFYILGINQLTQPRLSEPLQRPAAASFWGKDKEADKLNLPRPCPSSFRTHPESSKDLNVQNIDNADSPLFGRKLNEAAVNYDSIHPDDLRSLESYLIPHSKSADESLEDNNYDHGQYSKFTGYYNEFLQNKNIDNSAEINDDPAHNTRSVVGADGSENIIIKISASTADKSKNVPQANVEESTFDDRECFIVKDEFNSRTEKSRKDRHRSRERSRDRRRRSSSRKRKHRSRSSSRNRRRNSSSSHRDRSRERSKSRGKRKRRSSSRSRRSRDRSSERDKRKDANRKKKDLLDELKEEKRKSSSKNSKDLKDEMREKRIIKDINKHLQKNNKGIFN